ncbi:PHD finger protein 12-like isoform X2 [Corticium candelabrum]|uniref:PHD finger protein 12-like isoform X2 n=1 Tax=Corticium candelabrum TaxID=121492 RepID=UPI002E25FA45|nr:PHD finger protein 12-like isoform X2 [Corticium candelabrum]
MSVTTMSDTMINPGDLMERIQTIIAPPRCEEKTRGRKAASTCSPMVYTRVSKGRSSNHDRCDGCKEGGNLVCCDRCPAAFHLSCCDPPIEPGSLPTGEWLCRRCNPPRLSSDLHVVKPFRMLVEREMRENPASFSLPPHLVSNSHLALGPRKRRKSGEESKPAKHARSDHKEVRQPDYLVNDHTTKRFCVQCSRTSRVAPLLQCSFCPLSYHMDCLEPPRTSPPLGSWMCPCHAEHLHPDFSSELLSTKETLLDTIKHGFNEHTVKIDFLDKVHRMNHYGRRVAHTKRRSFPIPSSIKHLYKSPCLPHAQMSVPSFAELCEAAREARNPANALQSLQRISYDQSAVEAQRQQDEWLRSVIHLQSDITRFLSLPPVVRRSMTHQRDSLSDSDKSYRISPSTSDILSSKTDRRNSIINHPIENGVLSDSEELGDDNRHHMSQRGNVEEMSHKENIKQANSHKAVLLDHGCYALPNLSLLDADLVQLLAQQRLQQLLSTKSESLINKSVLPSNAESTANKNVSQQELTATDVLTRCHAVFCPLGCAGRLYPMRKRVVTLGSSQSCDVSLCHLTSCSRLSERHACVIYNKSIAQFELINYSEYGTLVDGIFYLSTHSSEQRTPDCSLPATFTTDTVKALGDGPRASRAQKRIEMTRSKWKDSSRTTTFLASLLKMSGKEGGVHVGISNTVTTAKDSPSVVQAQASSGSCRSHKDSRINSERTVERVAGVVDVSKLELRHNLRPRVKNDGSLHGHWDRSKRGETGSGQQTGRKDCCGDGLVRTIDGVCCGCARFQPSNSDDGWSGSAPLFHGSLIRIGCVQLLLSVTGQPGHAELVQSIVKL